MYVEGSKTKENCGTLVHFGEMGGKVAVAIPLNIGFLDHNRAASMHTNDV